ncbi:hypothetical protein AvCA_24450 [Azotobacter vinelandii CA]|uniref:Uncharacterized protein n=2 Tax=Azotobacter vinelandii TaxID=354 RepID=C1DHN7_AZOVD|nr:hypothetical protein Avin_24450 [Azotobacter vinelandii DJ]AGK14959.1 hypothetical protein AvCA_24450 [Azotobacter vinelandii CA]AGK20613.1 hypothetical protein AvCA6_24450 [Azotobacter vinelandii CA6]
MRSATRAWLSAVAQARSGVFAVQAPLVLNAGFYSVKASKIIIICIY